MTLIYRFNSIIYFNTRFRRRPLALHCAQRRVWLRHYLTGLPAFEYWILHCSPRALSDSFVHHFAFIRPVPIGIAWNSLLLIYIPSSPIVFTLPRKQHCHTHAYTRKWAWIRIGLSTIVSPVTVKRLAGPTALKSAAWVISKRRLVPHQKLPLPPAPVNPPSGRHQWAQANPASICNRQSTLASTAQITHSPRPTPADPSPNTGPLTSPPPSKPRPLQFLSLLLPPSKPWRLLRHNPLSLRCRARRRRHLETAASRLKRRPSSGTTPTHSIFYGFGRDGWILHDHLGWVSDSALPKLCCWMEKHFITGNEYIILHAGAHFLSGIRNRRRTSLYFLFSTNPSPLQSDLASSHS